MQPDEKFDVVSVNIIFLALWKFLANASSFYLMKISAAKIATIFYTYSSVNALNKPT